MPTSIAAWERLKVKSIIDGVDHVAHAMEQKWGVGRLRLLVDDDMRARFDRQQVWWSQAVWPPDASEPNLREVERIGEATKRGWLALDQAATASGQQPIDPNVWEVGLPDGRVLAIVKTNAEAHHVAKGDRELVVWSLEEVARIVDGASIVNAVKTTFPGATVTAVRDPTASPPIDPDELLDDDLSDLMGTA